MRYRPVEILAVVLIASVCCCAMSGQASAVADEDHVDPHADQRVPPGLAVGQNIQLVYVHLMNPTADEARNEQARQQIAAEFGIKPGAAFNELVWRTASDRVRGLPFVTQVESRLYTIGAGGQVAVAVLVTLQEPGEVVPPARQGALATGELGDLPELWRDDRSLLKLVVNPTVGVFADRDPWVGNPGAFVGQPDKDQTAVLETGIELGIGGITRLGDSDSYVYGAASYLVSGTLGKDIYTDDTSRWHGGVEDLYAGLLVARSGSDRSLNLSFGRQKFSLNRNLLIGHVLGASNAGERAATNLSPRNAYDMTVDARYTWGRFTLQAWFADPDESPTGDTRSQYAGLNFRYNDNQDLDATLTLLGAPRSDSRYATPDGVIGTREGLRAVNPRVRWNSSFGVAGLWLEAEWAHQWHTDLDMAADGMGLWAGYTLGDVGWRPSVLYRYAVFTGDDPSTGTYERFDALTGGVQRDWAQGMDMIKMVINRNLRTHRIEFSIKPADGLDLSLDYYHFRADERNNLGGQPPLATYASGHLGQEFTPTLQWMIGRHLYLQSFLSFVVPGPGLKDALPEPTRTWKTFQLACYGFF